MIKYWYCIFAFKLTIKISVSNHQCFCVGAFTPLTVDGNIIVDGVLASCYAFTNHDLAHIAMTPLRWFAEVIKWINKYNKYPVLLDVAENLDRMLFLSDVK